MIAHGLQYVPSSAEDDCLDVLEFLVENDRDEIDYGSLIIETISNDSVNVYKYLLERIIADEEGDMILRKFLMKELD